MSEIKFEAWPKTPRLFKDPMIITEKIDGTNAAVGVVEGWIERPDGLTLGKYAWAEVDGKPYTVYAQSRNRIITPQILSGVKGSDNYAFAEWVYTNHHDLARILGPGLHFGEWWGVGIARNYGRTDRSFSLFNTSRWRHLEIPEAREAISPPKELTVVPVLDVHTLDTAHVLEVMAELHEHGSLAAPGFMDPEGVIVYLPGVGRTFKVTYEGDRGKWELAQLATGGVINSADLLYIGEAA